MLLLASLGGPGTLLAAGVWIVAPCAIVFTAALMDIDMIQVPPEMNVTRKDGAFWFEKATASRSGDREFESARDGDGWDACRWWD